MYGKLLTVAGDNLEVGEVATCEQTDAVLVFVIVTIGSFTHDLTSNMLSSPLWDAA